jgi:cytochrome c5
MFKLFVVLTMVFGIIGSVQASEKPFGERSLMSESSIAERVSRNGAVCLEGEPCVGQPPEAAPTSGSTEPSGPRAGDVVYNNFCAGCHASGAAGAPKVGDAAAWSARMDKHGSEEALWKSGWTGIGIMPAKGMCGDCSEEEFSSAVSHMLSNSQ